jgi:hypothetical protein
MKVKVSIHIIDKEREVWLELKKDLSIFIRV